MSANQLIMLAVSTAVSLISAILWHWIRANAKDKDTIRGSINVLRGDVARDLTTLRREYQRRDDAQRDHAQILDLVREVKRQTDRIYDKLEQKADK